MTRPPGWLAGWAVYRLGFFASVRAEELAGAQGLAGAEGECFLLISFAVIYRFSDVRGKQQVVGGLLGSSAPERGREEEVLRWVERVGSMAGWRG